MRRRLAEATAWIVAVTFLWTVDTFSKLSYRDQTGFGKDNFRLITDQATSAAAALIMIIFIVHWLKLFPLRKDAWVPAIIGHTAGSIIFAFGHFSLMVLFRMIIHRLNGTLYIWRDPFVSNLIIEYQKDIKIYIGIVLVIAAYQYYRSTRMPTSQPTPQGSKLIVQTGSGETVVRFDEIYYLEASRNYVVVHAGDREYLVRDTIRNLEEKLSGGPFARSHRSFVVNTDKIKELKSVDSGYRVFLRNGADLPLSRSYRDALKSRMAS